MASGAACARAGPAVAMIAAAPSNVRRSISIIEPAVSALVGIS